jgi:hypothetical protein
MSPEQLPAQPPHVTYQGGTLSIDSQNASLADILHEIHNQTGSQVDLPSSLGKERVAAHMSGAPREVVSGLLDGARVGYIILGSPDDPNGVQKIILSALPQEQNNGQAPAPAGGNALWKAGPPSAEAQEEEQAETEPPPPPPPPQPAAQVNPYTAQQPPDQNAPMKTPQQMLQNLQKMRDQQNQNAQQQ